MPKRGPRKIKVPVSTGTESGFTQTTSDLDQIQDSLDKGAFSLAEATTAEPLSEDLVGQQEKVVEKGRTWADTLADMLSGVTQIRTFRLFFILLFVWVVLEAWLFIQDNGASRLNDWQGLKWFGIKLLLTSAFFIFFIILIVIISLIENKFRNKSGNKK